MIPRSSTEKLAASFPPGVVSMTVIEGADHNDIGARAGYLETIQAALTTTHSPQPLVVP